MNNLVNKLNQVRVYYLTITASLPNFSPLVQDLVVRLEAWEIILVTNHQLPHCQLIRKLIQIAIVSRAMMNIIFTKLNNTSLFNQQRRFKNPPILV
jgi:hypothetical protein